MKQHVTDLQYLLKYYGHTFLLYDQPRLGTRDVSIQHRGNRGFEAEIGFVQTSFADDTKIDLVVPRFGGGYSYIRVL